MTLQESPCNNPWGYEVMETVEIKVSGLACLPGTAHTYPQFHLPGVWGLRLASDHAPPGTHHLEHPCAARFVTRSPTTLHVDQAGIKLSACFSFPSAGIKVCHCIFLSSLPGRTSCPIFSLNHKTGMYSTDMLGSVGWEHIHYQQENGFIAL